MSTDVLITLIICSTIIILFGTVMIAAAVLSKNKKQDDPMDYLKSDFPTSSTWETIYSPKYGRAKNEDKK